jgi:hypothetical protein
MLHAAGVGVMSLTEAVDLLTPALSDQEVIYYQSLLELAAGGVGWGGVGVVQGCSGCQAAGCRRHLSIALCTFTALSLHCTWPHSRALLMNLY